VGRAAQRVVLICREAFKSDPGILAGTSLPNYERVVSVVTQAALSEMVAPGVLCVGAPVAVGFAGRFVGELTGRPLLGAEVLAGYLVFGTVSGILMALFLDNVGGAWDNAKKYVELGHYGGKGSEAHKAAVTGDTVGDPLKDTAGPSLHVVIKLLSTTILVLGPLFVGGRTGAPV
jgi:inorganic pyrophosphatase